MHEIKYGRMTFLSKHVHRSSLSLRAKEMREVWPLQQAGRVISFTCIERIFACDVPVI